MNKISVRLADYFSLVTFSHTIFALPFAVIGFVLGAVRSGGFPGWSLFVKVLACMVLARSAAMAFNRYLDRDVDKLNPRTAGREIPAGVIKASSAMWLVRISSVLFMFTCYLINPLCFYLSPIALAVVLGYSYTKRFTWLCHFVLGLGLALAPIGAYLAVTGEFNGLPLVYSFAVFTWVSGFDLIYALQDESFDRAQGLHSVPVLLGARGALMVSSLLHVTTTLLLVFAGWLGKQGWFYHTGLLLFVLLLIYQHRIVKPHDLSKVNRAFGATNGYASVIFCLFFLLDIWFS